MEFFSSRLDAHGYKGTRTIRKYFASRFLPTKKLYPSCGQNVPRVSANCAALRNGPFQYRRVEAFLETRQLCEVLDRHTRAGSQTAPLQQITKHLAIWAWPGRFASCSTKPSFRFSSTSAVFFFFFFFFFFFWLSMHRKRNATYLSLQLIALRFCNSVHTCTNWTHTKHQICVRNQSACISLVNGPVSHKKATFSKWTWNAL